MGWENLPVLQDTELLAHRDGVGENGGVAGGD